MVIDGNEQPTNSESVNTSDVAPQIEDLHKKIQSLEEGLKERESNLFKAIHTLVTDYWAFQNGMRTDFPKAALLGLVFAYLRPRIVLVFGSLAAGVVAVSQVWILVAQNELIRQQNESFDRQAGTQRRLIERQNDLQSIQTELSSVGLVADLRGRFTSEQAMPFAAAPTSLKILAKAAGCNVTKSRNALPLSPNPNFSIIDSISRQAKNPEVGDRVRVALSSLLEDSNGGVVLGALLVFERLGLKPPKDELVVNDVNLNRLEIKSSINIEFVRSRISEITCMECNLAIIESHARGVVAKSFELTNSWLEGADPHKLRVVYSSFVHTHEFSYEVLSGAKILNSFFVPFPKDTNPEVMKPTPDIFKLLPPSKQGIEKTLVLADCGNFESICEDNPLLDCRPSDS